MTLEKKYRIHKIDDIIDNTFIKDNFKTIMDTGILPNMIFHGDSSTGKTCTLKALCNQIDIKVISFDSKDNKSISSIRNNIKFYLKDIVDKNKSNVSWKLILIDNADIISKESQSILRRAVEKNINTVKFCIIVNDIKNIIDSLLSRFIVFKFNKLSTKSLYNRLDMISTEEKINISEEKIKSIILLSNNNLRKCYDIIELNNILDKENNAEYNKYLSLYQEKQQDLYKVIFEKKDKNKIIDISKEIYTNGYPLTLQLKLIYEYILILDTSILDNEKKLKIISNILDISNNGIKNGFEFIELVNFYYMILFYIT